jgi:hypothetical protein
MSQENVEAKATAPCIRRSLKNGTAAAEPMESTLPESIARLTGGHPLSERKSQNRALIALPKPSDFLRGTTE